MSENKFFKRADILLITVILLVAAVGFLIIEFVVKGPGAQVVITVEGNVYGSYDLNQNQVVEIKTDNGINILHIENGYAYMNEADCRDKICVNKGKISKTGETIVCLPHKVVVEIKGSTDSINGVV